MPDLSALLAKIPDDLKPLVALGIGALMLVFIVMFHGVGLHLILVLRKRRERRLRVGRPHLVAALLLFGWSVFLMLTLHIAGVMMWAYALMYLGLIPRAYDAIYFCANAYTTLGYGSVDLEAHWRNISPIIGISGLFTFAWTTSVLVDVVASHKQLIEQLEDERERELHMRSTLWKAEWDALMTERDAERSNGEKTRTQMAGASFLQRRKIRWGERKRVQELRMAKAAEIENFAGKSARTKRSSVLRGVPPTPSDKR